MPPLTDNELIWAFAFILVLITGSPVFLRLRKKERRTEEAHRKAVDYGLHEPVSLHPVVDPARCIGSSSCVAACPEGVLGIRAGQAVAVSPARCIGHGLCERSCPMEAIRLVFGTATRGVELPRIQGNFETNVPGLYVIGELGGMGLVANAFEQGRRCVEGIVGEGERAKNGLLDLVIVGCGPAGLSASLTALAHDLRFVTLEREDLGGTVRHYPRKKVVMTRTVKVPGYGRLPLREIQKEELIELWTDMADKAGLRVREGQTVTAVDRVGPDHFRVRATGGTVESRRVILAVGRRGVPRKLRVPGEEGATHVSYSLREPEAYRGDRVVVVGGGDSAVEAALALADQPGTTVRLSYRGERFTRIKPANLDRVEQATRGGRLELLMRTVPEAIGRDRVRLTHPTRGRVDVPSDQVFVFIGGELPTPFLRACGVEIETHFGEA